MCTLLIGAATGAADCCCCCCGCGCYFCSHNRDLSLIYTFVYKINFNIGVCLLFFMLQNNGFTNIHLRTFARPLLKLLMYFYIFFMLFIPFVLQFSFLQLLITSKEMKKTAEADRNVVEARALKSIVYTFKNSTIIQLFAKCMHFLELFVQSAHTAVISFIRIEQIYFFVSLQIYSFIIATGIPRYRRIMYASFLVRFLLYCWRRYYFFFSFITSIFIIFGLNSHYKPNAALLSVSKA